MSFLALHGPVAAAGGAGASPLDYDSDLLMFLDAQNGVTQSSNNVSAWQGQSPNAINFSVPSGDEDPLFQSSAQNGLPGINFNEDVGSTNGLRKRLESGDNDLDNIFSGSGNKAISFAARADKLRADDFNVGSNLVEKGFRGSKGWLILVSSDGSVSFRHKRGNGSTWEIKASGFLSAGDLLLGHVIYSGGNNSGSGTMFLYNGASFVETGSVTTGSSSTIGTDAADAMVVGNQRLASPGFNSPFHGPIMGIWVTKPARTSIDFSYMERWIP